MPQTLKIDFVSDISCPWCAIGLSALGVALERIGQEIQVEIEVQPFELNPAMGENGQEISEYLTQKYGSTPEEQAGIRETIRQRGATVGFTFREAGREWIYNTFDAHRLLHWAAEPDTRPAGRQLALKQALMRSYFTEGESPASHTVLQKVASEVGLDAAQAADVLASNRYADAVRARERHFTEAGIRSVPAVIINDQYLISGGQPAEVFENALRKIAAGAA